MVSPMREKRVWPPARKEADAAETVAQFEATVAVAKQTVAKSGEVLSSAKEDLNEHQRWLQLQTAAVEKDRIRHERWLQRQRERKEAAERKEEARLRRSAFFQRVWAGIKSAVLAVIYAITGAIGFVVRSVVGAIAFVLRSIGRGFAFVGTSIRNFVLYLFRQIRFAALWFAVKLQELFGAAGAGLVAGLAAVAAALGGFARSATRTTSGAIVGASARAGALARSTGEAMSSGMSQVSAKAGELARSTGEAVSSGVSQVSAKAGELARSTGEAVSSGVSQVSAKTQELASHALARQELETSSSEDRADFAPEHQPVSPSDDQSMAEMPGAPEPVATALEATEAPAFFRTAAERAAQPTVSEFVVRPEAFASENVPDNFAHLTDAEAEAIAEPHADLTVPARFEAAEGERYAHKEIVFGSEPDHESDATPRSEIAERARAFGNEASAKLAAAFAGVAAVAATLGRRVAATSAAIVALASAKFRDMAPTAGKRIAQSVSGASAKSRELGSAAVSSIKPAFSSVSGRMQTALPALHGLVTGAGGKARHYAGAGAAVAAGGMAQVKRLRDAGKNALSLPEGVDRDRGEISRMLIVAGILMLICGALLIGGGFLLRTGAPSMPSLSSPFSSEPEPAEAAGEVDVVWLFDDPERTFEERSVFTVAGGATAARLTGLAFNAENWSDHTLTDFHGTVKPDLKIIDFKLAIDLVESVGPMPASPAPDTVPPRTVFRLMVPFPREVMDGEAGVDVDDFLSDYGGLTLKVHYAVDGREKSFIQYLSPSMLKAQLAEIAGSAGSLARF